MASDPEPLRILLVEDRADDAFLTMEALRDAGFAHDVRHVEDGHQAMAYLHDASATRPHLVLLDLKLPRKDGLQVLAEIKSSPELRQLAVIVLTTSVAENDIRRAYDGHVNAYVRKPAGTALSSTPCAPSAPSSASSRCRGDRAGPRTRSAPGQPAAAARPCVPSAAAGGS